MAQGREAGRGGKARGVSIARLKAEWPAIVGRDIARVSQPEALLPGRGGKAGKALRLRVAARRRWKSSIRAARSSSALTPTSGTNSSTRFA